MLRAENERPQKQGLQDKHMTSKSNKKCQWQAQKVTDNYYKAQNNLDPLEDSYI